MDGPRAIARCPWAGTVSQPRKQLTKGALLCPCQAIEQLILGSPKSQVDRCGQFASLSRRDDPSVATIRGIGSTLNQPGLLEAVENVDQDAGINADLLGQSDLAAHGLVRYRRQDLVSARTGRDLGDYVAGRPRIGPKDHTEVSTE